MNWLETVREIIEALFNKNDAVEPMNPVSTPKSDPVVPKYLWDTQEHAIHSVRVICDEQDLSWENKALICACIMQESQFYNTAVNHNRNKLGQITSTDWGICQINDTPTWHIGPKLAFSSVADVVGNPDKAVRFMISMFKTGHLNAWVSYSSSEYEKYLPQFLNFKV